MSEIDPQRLATGDMPSLKELRRLGKNTSGYAGETIDIGAVLSDCVAAARAHGWAIEEIQAAPNLHLLAFTRRALPAAEPASSPAMRSMPITHPGARVYLSTGIHGDEPAGPLAMRQLLLANAWPVHLDLWVCPCLNPGGFLLNRRENAEGVDLNRQYLHPRAAETVAHIGWLRRQPGFDLCLCLHEDWESHGFYVYELNPEIGQHWPKPWWRRWLMFARLTART
jgi:protein MpaA